MHTAEWSPWRFRSCRGVHDDQMIKKNTAEGISQYRVIWAKNCFHYSLIDTSKRICTDNAISIKAILHVERKGKLCTSI